MPSLVLRQNQLRNWLGLRLMDKIFCICRLGGSPSIVAQFLVFCLTVLSHSHSACAVDESTTLILYNKSDVESTAIRDKYLEVHPGVRTFGLSLPGISEDITGQEYLDQIHSPLLELLTYRSWGAQIDTIVTTKGLPLRIDAGANTQTDWQRFSSFESELTRLDAIDSIEEMGDQNFSPALANEPGVLPANPYYLGPELDPDTYELIPYDGPAGFDRSDPTNENIRLVSRLDGYSLEDVIGMIDRAQSAYVVPFGHNVVVDDHPAAPASAETAMTELATIILPSHTQLTDFDQTNVPITSSSDPVIGYVGHGVHSGLPGGIPGNLDETGYLVASLDFEYANGAVFHTYESFNAYSFDLASTSPTTSQGQLGQWIATGGTAGLGHVQEPTASKWTVTNEDIFFDMLLSGHTLAEAAWAATRQLSFVNTVIGDPLMRWMPWIPGDVDLDGEVGSEDSGILFANWEATGVSFAQGDLNGDNIANSADAGILIGNWTFPQIPAMATGPPPPSVALAAFSIPEPASMIVALVCACGALMNRNRCFILRDFRSLPNINRSSAR